MLAAPGTAVILGGLLAGAGTFGDQLGIEDAATKLSLGGLMGGLVALAVMLGAGWLGGRLGERYHRRADSVVAPTRSGAVAEPRRVVRSR